MHVTTKGQITLPKPIRERHGIRPGMDIEVVEENGRIIVRKRTARRGIESLVGILRGSPWKRTDDLINALRGRV